MKLVLLILGSVFLIVSDGFFVQVPTGPLYIRLGGSVVLPCYVDQPLPMKRLKVEWTRTDSNNLVHLFIYGESRPEEQHQDYYDRAHFFDDYVKDGIFSLRLDNLRAEDVGFYRCKVYSQKDVGETVVHIKDVEHLIVSGPNHPVSAYVGEDVTLSCSVDSHIQPEKISWRKIDKDYEIPVLLFPSNNMKPEVADERYRDRVEFFTAEIPKGNFSLRLKSVRSEDKGVYMCHVKNGRLSANTTVIIERLEHLIVSGSDHSISSASVGENVILNCSVENYIPPEEISWRRKDKDGDILLLDFQKGKCLSSDERYRDRVEFFTAEIPKGNFSLRLNHIRTEDKGVYMCYVRNGRMSANTTVIIERLSFSVLHIIILVLCIAASGSALLLWYLIYHGLQNYLTVACLQICLIFLPNIIMFIAVILWGFSEGFLHETIACSALYLLRPCMLFRAGPYGSRVFNGWRNYGLWSFIEYIVFTGVVYPVLFKYALDRSWDSGVLILSLMGGTFGMILLLGLLMLLFDSGPSHRRNDVTPMLTIAGEAWLNLFLILCFYLCGLLLLGIQVLMATGVLPLLASLLNLVHNDNTYKTYTQRQSDSCLAERGLYLCNSLPIVAFMFCFYIMVLKNHEDYFGWFCVITFLQIKWTHMQLTCTFNDSVCHYSVFVYLFGSVVVVMLSSSTLMTELILKILNGERALGDLRTVLFPSESLFALFLLILQKFKPGKTCVYEGCLTPAIIILSIVFFGAFMCSLIKYPNVQPCQYDSMESLRGFLL